MNLPLNYTPVLIKDIRLRKTIGVGFVNTYSKTLYVFSPKETIEYNANEVIELFTLHIPDSEQSYDLNKLFNL